MKRCKTIKYEAFGMECIAYCGVDVSDEEIRKLIKQIVDTAMVFSIYESKVSESDFNVLHLDKVAQWINDLKNA